MKLAYQTLLPTDISKSSRVWIYQATRIFSIQEALEIEDRLEQFTQNWQSHGAPVKAVGLLLFGQFIVLIADETTIPVGGCSTDSSVREIKKIEQLPAPKEFETILKIRIHVVDKAGNISAAAKK